jgi:hypothetical protein
MNHEAILDEDNPNKARKLILEAVGPDDIELLTCLAAALQHKRCIRVFKTDDPFGKHYEYHPGEDEHGH